MPKSLFVDPSVVRAPGKVTLPGARTTLGSTNKFLGICISLLNYFESRTVKFSRLNASSFWNLAAGVPSTARWS